MKKKFEEIADENNGTGQVTVDSEGTLWKKIIHEEFTLRLDQPNGREEQAKPRRYVPPRPHWSNF